MIVATPHFHLAISYPAKCESRSISLHILTNKVMKQLLKIQGFSLVLQILHAVSASLTIVVSLRVRGHRPHLIAAWQYDVQGRRLSQTAIGRCCSRYSASAKNTGNLRVQFSGLHTLGTCRIISMPMEISQKKIPSYSNSVAGRSYKSISDPGLQCCQLRHYYSVYDRRQEPDNP